MRAPGLDPRWLPLIDGVARGLLGPHDRVGPALALEVQRLSERYTRRGGALREAAVERAARLRFFVPRDLPKIGGPLAELAAVGALPAAPVWRVLDVGAGLGTTSLGAAALARALPAPPERLDVIALEREPALLDGMRALAEAARTVPGLAVTIELQTRSLDLESAALGAITRGGPFDLVLMGLCLNELFAGADAVAARSRLVLALAEALAPGGALSVLEPALYEVTREVMQLRDLLVAAGTSVFAPCPRTARCPMLARERDWCHEDLSLSLPPALAKIAKEAKLRFEGLSYSYLTLRAGPSLTELLSANARIVGGPVPSKGKVELFACTGDREIRLNVLTRDDLDGQTSALGRGAVVALEGEALGGEDRGLAHGARWGRDVRGEVRRGRG